MSITLSQEQEAFIRKAIDGGRFDRVEDAVAEALLLREARERRRAEFIATLDEAEASIARDEGIEITRESMEKLAEDIKRRGREGLAEEKRQAG
jgi:Arc/MetJ-type ribon-helix-helix transcriptional regulator